MLRKTLVATLTTMAVLAPVAAHSVVYGEPDDGEHPAVGSFVGEFTDPDSGETTLFQLCTGTLIDDDVVLSASHCFSGLPPTITRTWFTLAEVIDADRDGVVDASVDLRAGTAVTHPLYASGGVSNLYDIAVFLLDDAVVGIEPAELAGAGLLDAVRLKDETFTAVGYGTVRETNQRSSQSFLPGWRREKADQEALSLTKAWLTLSMNLATGNGGTCYGDSGGPHFLGDVVVSVTVTGDVPCKATDKTYRVDTPWARDFLDAFVTLP